MAGCVRLQQQNMEDESRGTTQTCTVRSDEKSVRSCPVCVVKVRSQIPLLQATGKDKQQCRGTIHNFFEGVTKAF